MSVDLRLGDCLSVMAGLPENSVDTIITDPPYGLEFMGKDWDRGVPGVAFWREALRVAKPGAMLLAMGGTRTFHRLVVAIEDAGWEVRDSIAWLYGSGFPKSYNISKGIDKQAGAERDVVGKYKRPDGTDRPNRNNWNKLSGEWGENSGFDPRADAITAPSTPAAKLWHGWGTALKPAMELICVAMKPIDGGFVHNALTWGVAGFWIDGGRVGTDTISQHGRNANSKPAQVPQNEYKPDNSWQGRFPANVIHDGSDEVTGLFPQTKSGVAVRHNSGGNTFGGNNPKPPMDDMAYNDSGSAARFFYCAKASRSERNAGLESVSGKPVAWSNQAKAELKRGNLEFSDGDRKHNKVEVMQNHHPTVKPLALMRYLARLTKTPTGGVVLDPFMGSGTTGMAAVLEGRDFIGIELNPEYLEIAEKRIAHAQGSIEVELPLFAEAVNANSD